MQRTRHGIAAIVACAALLTAAHAQAEILSVQVERARFREGPGTAHDILFTADRYFPVRVLERKGGWVKVVDFEDEQAWVSRKLLGPREAVVVSVEKTNVRGGPGLKHEVVTRAEYGVVFRVVEREGRWLQIGTRREVVGWVRDDMTWGDEDA